ncbi:MAG: hypothetical protein IJ747_08360 [Lachnospiraceae bacterium]|nr:hypothetical protein [Lachnospiraceae bacterium]
MKKTTTILIVLSLAAALSACGLKSSKEIAETGGEQPESSQRAFPRRAVMANGVLYLDTGYVSGIWGRCGNLDGNIEKVIDRTELPDEDGEANFEAYGWQVGFEENTIDVPIGDEFCIFGAKGTEQGVQGYIPKGVLQFMATVEEVSDDGYMVVKADFDIPAMFGQIKKDGRYRLSLEHYEPGIYTDTPVPGNIVVVICKGIVEETDPAILPEIYSISPVGGNVCQPAVIGPCE